MAESSPSSPPLLFTTEMAENSASTPPLLFTAESPSSPPLLITTEMAETSPSSPPLLFTTEMAENSPSTPPLLFRAESPSSPPLLITTEMAENSPSTPPLLFTAESPSSPPLLITTELAECSLYKTDNNIFHQYEKPTPLQVTLAEVAEHKYKTNFLTGAWQQRNCPNMYKTAELMRQHGDDLTKKGKILEDETKELARYYMFAEERHRILFVQTKNFINDAKTFFADVESHYKELQCWDVAHKKPITEPRDVVEQFSRLSIWDSPTFCTVGRYAAPSIDTIMPIGRGARRHLSSS